MKKVYDYEIDPATGDRVIRNGDWAIIESTQQHQRDLVQLDPGSFTQFPEACVGINRYLNDDSSASELKSKIVEQLEADGQSIDILQITADGQLQLQGGYG